MKHHSLSWLVPVLSVMIPVLGLVGWELLQRHRFTVEADRLQAALERFADTAAFPGEDGKPLPTASGRSSLPYFNVATSQEEDWRVRERIWTVSAVFADPQGWWHPLRAEFHLHQDRKFLMRSPELTARYTGEQDGLSGLLGPALAGFDYQTVQY
jgi:hypothetical protein